MLPDLSSLRRGKVVWEFSITLTVWRLSIYLHGRIASAH